MMRVPRRPTVLGRLEAAERRAPAVVATPLSVGSGPEPPSARVYKSGQQEVPTGVVTPVTFDSERWDNAELHSVISNTGRLTAPTAGVYTVSGHAAWRPEVSGPWFIAIRVNGTKVYAAQWTPAAFQSEASTHTEVKLAMGDYVELVVYQGSGKTIKTAAAGESTYPNGAELTMTWLSAG